MKKHTLKKVAASAVLAGALALGAPAVANAYVPPTPDQPVVAGNAVPGGTVTVTFSGFESGESVEFALTGESAGAATLATIVKTAVETQTLTKNAAGDGAASVETTLPQNATGTYTLTATGAESGLVQNVTLTVGGGGGGGDLPTTGFDNGALLGLWVGGGALVLAGGAVVTATAVRRQRANSAA